MRLFSVNASLARELDLNAFKDRQMREWVDFGNQLGVKVHVRGQGRDRHKRGVADAEQRRDSVWYEYR